MVVLSRLEAFNTNIYTLKALFSAPSTIIKEIQTQMQAMHPCNASKNQWEVYKKDADGGLEHLQSRRQDRKKHERRRDSITR
jgi:hypothetical protein